jgi:hypothetical protein
MEMTRTILSVSIYLIFASISMAVEEGLVGYWPFDEGSGKVAKDASGTGNDGQFVNNPKWVNGKFGNALELDGNSSYVAVPDNETLNITSDLTIMAWFNPNDVLTSRRMMSKNNSIFVIFDFGDPNSVELLVKPNNDFVESKTKDWKVGEWYHFAGTFDGKTLRVYINGELEGENDIGQKIATSNLELWIGADDLGNPDAYFPGIIDEVRIYNKTLTEAQIKEAMAGPFDVHLRGKLPIIWATIKQDK